MYFFLDFFRKKKLFGHKYKKYYEIRLLKGKRIHFILGFYDCYNNFIFLNFQNFCHYFLSISLNFKKQIINIPIIDFLFFSLIGIKYYFFNGTFYMNNKMYFIFFKRANRLIRKIFLKGLERGIKGYTWGKILVKQTKLINKLNHEREFLF